MSRYIDADAVMHELDREVELADDWKTAHEIANVVKYFQPADVRENVHGEWETDSDNLPFCSKCGEIALQRVFVKVPHLIQDVRMVRSNFCPNCGALMSESLKLAEIGKAIAEGLNEGLNCGAEMRDRQAEEMLPEVEDENDL